MMRCVNWISSSNMLCLFAVDRLLRLCACLFVWEWRKWRLSNWYLTKEACFTRNVSKSLQEAKWVWYVLWFCCCRRQNHHTTIVKETNHEDGSTFVARINNGTRAGRSLLWFYRTATLHDTHRGKSSQETLISTWQRTTISLITSPQRKTSFSWFPWQN